MFAGLSCAQVACEVIPPLLLPPAEVSPASRSDKSGRVTVSFIKLAAEERPLTAHEIVVARVAIYKFRVGHRRKRR